MGSILCSHRRKPSRHQSQNDLRHSNTAGLFNNMVDPDNIFETLNCVGHGSSCYVYKATCSKTGDIVAIKKMMYKDKANPGRWKDVLREIRFLKELKHPNIIGFKGCYMKDNTVWLVMEYCPISASKIIKYNQNALKEDEIAAICIGVLKALNYLHNSRKIYRDLKASNILLTDKGIVKLADFGIASIKCPTNSFVGTAHWMAPEVILAMEQGRYDIKVDIWSLGITCLELAQGNPPYYKLNNMSALYKIGEQDPPTLTIKSDWSEEFNNFLATCLQRNPASRPDCTKLLEHTFLTKSRADNVLFKLVSSTEAIIQDNVNVREQKKQMLIENCQINSNADN